MEGINHRQRWPELTGIYASLKWDEVSPPKSGDQLLLSVRVLGAAPIARRPHCFMWYAWGIMGEFHVCLDKGETFQVIFSNVPDYI